MTKVKEELDVIPAKVRVLEYMQEKAVFVEQVEGEKQRQIKAAQMPRHPIARAMGSVSLMCLSMQTDYLCIGKKASYPVMAMNFPEQHWRTR